MNPKVDAFIENEKRWHDEFVALRAIALASGLTEELKWGVPCYAHGGKNVVLIHGFKEYCALLFVKGAILPDPGKLFVIQTVNVQSARQIRFASLEEIERLKGSLASYIRVAAEAEKSGASVPLKKTADFSMPAEFANALAANRALKEAFEALTPGRQRAYLLYFGGAKQAKTREARIEKCESRILDGLGLDD